RWRRGRGRGGRGPFVQRQHDLPDRHLVAALDLDLRDRPRHRRRHFDRRLVGLELEDALVLGDRVADLDEDVQDVAALDAVPEIGDLEFGGHVSYETAGFFLSTLMPRSLIASCTTLASIFFSLRRAVRVANTMKRAS